MKKYLIFLFFIIPAFTHAEDIQSAVISEELSAQPIPSAQSIRRQKLIGTWYGETKDQSGGCIREITDMSDDGKFVVRFREISVIGDYTDWTEYGSWGISGPVLFAITTAMTDDEKITPTDLAQAKYYDAYKISKISDTKFVYKHYVKGTIYKDIKVPNDFQFPETPCKK